MKYVNWFFVTVGLFFITLVMSIDGMFIGGMTQTVLCVGGILISMVAWVMFIITWIANR